MFQSRCNMKVKDIVFNKETNQYITTIKRKCCICGIEDEEGYLCPVTEKFWCNPCFQAKMVKDSQEMLRHIQRVHYTIPTMAKKPYETRFLKITKLGFIG